MKKIISSLIAILIMESLFAQAPEAMSYQAIIRNNNDQLISNQNIGIQISILQDNTNGTAVYVETQTPTSNVNGLVSLEIGMGTIVSGNFENINWSAGSYFIKTEVDPLGGQNYSIIGTSQMLSVPYAFHAKTADSLTGTIIESDPLFAASVAAGITATDTAYWSNKQNTLIAGEGIQISGDTVSLAPINNNAFYLGQDTLGGVVFYIYFDQHGDQHGLIVSKIIGAGQWQSNLSTTQANRTWDGIFNFNLMTNSPIKTWIQTFFTPEWYIPSIDELSILWHNRYHVNKAFHEAGVSLLQNIHYWSSTEASNSQAWYFAFMEGAIYGYTTNNTKTMNHNVLVIKSF